MSKIKFTLLTFSFLLAATAGYSQEKYHSEKQEQCSWNKATQTYDNCQTQNKDSKINIDESKKVITITRGNKVNIFQIISKQAASGKTTFRAVEATGVAKTIVLTSAQMEVLTNTSKETFFLK